MGMHALRVGDDVLPREIGRSLSFDALTPAPETYRCIHVQPAGAVFEGFRHVGREKVVIPGWFFCDWGTLESGIYSKQTTFQRAKQTEQQGATH